MGFPTGFPYISYLPIVLSWTISLIYSIRHWDQGGHYSAPATIFERKNRDEPRSLNRRTYVGVQGKKEDACTEETEITRGRKGRVTAREGKEEEARRKRKRALWTWEWERSHSLHESPLLGIKRESFSPSLLHSFSSDSSVVGRFRDPYPRFSSVSTFLPFSFNFLFYLLILFFSLFLSRSRIIIMMWLKISLENIWVLFQFPFLSFDSLLLIIPFP